MVRNKIKSIKTNILSVNCLLITKRKRKRSFPNERGLEETEKKEGKWKKNGGEERERGGDREEKRVLPVEVGECHRHPRVGGCACCLPGDGFCSDGRLDMR